MKTTTEQSRRLAVLLNKNADEPKAYDLQDLFDLLPKEHNVTWIFGYGGYDFNQSEDLEEYYVDFEIEGDEPVFKSFFNKSMFDVVFDAVCWWIEYYKKSK